MSETNLEVLEKIRAYLNEAGVDFRESEHGPTRTSAEAAAARGEDMRIGAKALLLKTDDTFRLFVLPADRKLRSAAIRHRLGVKRTRFAHVDELREMTGLVPGCVPPFGEPILPFELYADDDVGVVSNRVAFNAGSLCHSIIMSAADWERLARPVRFSFSKL
jgi:Ala-tRNA(Pro) deacylase